MSGEINHDRRRFLGSAAITIAAAKLGLIDSAHAQSSNTEAAGATTIKLGTKTSFGALKQIDAGLISINSQALFLRARSKVEVLG